jgi:hypothetical protein
LPIQIDSALGKSSLCISRRGNAWVARLQDMSSGGVPVTLIGMRRALNGACESFVGLTDGLVFHWVGGELRAEYNSAYGKAMHIAVSEASMARALDMMDEQGVELGHSMR